MHETQMCRRASLNIEYFEPRIRWATAAEHHTGCHLYQLRTGATFSTGSPKMKNRRLEKCFSGRVKISTVTFNTVRSSCGINDGVESICNSRPSVGTLSGIKKAVLKVKEGPTQF